jgi:hypothetical protein
MGKGTDLALGAIGGIILTVLVARRARKTLYPAWDINQDGVVDGLDLQILQSAFGALRGETGYRADADLNRDGIVDFDDLAILTAHLGEDYRTITT